MIGNNTEGVDSYNPALESAASESTAKDDESGATPVNSSDEGEEMVGGDAAETDRDERDTGRAEVGNSQRGESPRRVSISIGARSLAYSGLLIMLVAAIAALAWLYIGARGELDAQSRGAADNAHAERVALDYAVNAATMNFQDLNGWTTKLVADTSPELNDKLTKAAESMQQILVPLQWTSTAHPLAAKVHSEAEGIFTVDCFVSVQTKTVQAPDALQSTATYSLTIDSKNNWQITDVGGIGSLVEQR